MTGANILARVGTFLGNLAIIRLLGLDLVGELGLIESWLNVALIFAVFGLNAAATKFVSQLPGIGSGAGWRDRGDGAGAGWHFQHGGGRARLCLSWDPAGVRVCALGQAPERGRP